MFEILRRAIDEAITQRSFGDPGRVARTFVICCDVPAERIRTFLYSAFLHDRPQLMPLQPWFTAGDQQTIEADTRSAVAAAFDVSLAERLSRSGITIADSANLAILIVDACTEGPIARAEKAAEALKSALAEIVGSETPLYLAGVFLIARPQTAADADTTAPNPSEFIRISRDASARLKGFVRETVHKAFLLDVSNPQQLLTKAPHDQHALIAHLVYYLMSRAAARTSGNFVQWLSGGEAQYGRVGGISAYSVVLPVRRIVQLVTLFQGARVVESALFEPDDPSRFKLYVNAYLSENGLVTVQETRERISSRIARDLPNALESIDRLFLDDYPTLSDVSSGREVIRSLEDLSDDLSKQVRTAAENHAKDCAVSLEDHLEELVAREFGGLLSASEFLNSVADHLQQFLESQEGRKLEDPNRAVDALEAEVKRVPRRQALFTRALLLSAVAPVTVLSFPIPFVWRIVTGAASLFVPFLAAVFADHANREKLRNLAIDVDAAIRAKWHDLSERKWAEILGSHVTLLMDKLGMLRTEVEKAEQRSRELIQYYREVYEPPAEPSSTFLNRAVESREEILQFAPRCAFRPAEFVDEFVGVDRPLRLWRRLATPGAGLPDGWEARLFERAAGRVLAQCPELVQIDLLSWLEENDRLEGYKAALVRAAQPFLRVSPGAPRGDPFAVLEVEDHACVAELEATLRRQFERLERRVVRPPLRLSFIGLYEGISMDDVLP